MKLSSISMKHIYIFSFTTSNSIIYVTLVDDKVIIDYLLGYWLIRPLFGMKMKLEINFLFFKFLAQSKLEYLLINNFC